ncbi:TonB-dependent receptor [Persicobacter psychrovividus]|uniref:SusC/RagA family TonB-linked outer membrane protein n=1 Tax=Persicobacter psychrovividus TaxID=387638 RepID=A0ABN6LH74_9BACT|nr:SusC/RagA family TonB-linked outer membrane protein [Persicobacter psychrovividus]
MNRTIFLKKSKWVLFFFLLIIQYPNVAVGQNLINGTVTNSTGVGIPGVSITVKGTTNGTITDVNGSYQLSASPKDYLNFSFVGLVSQEILVGDQVMINVIMKEDVVDLEEFIVIGYGVQKKSDVTGSVSSIETEGLKKNLSPNIDQALQGRAAGVMVISNSGSPGANASVNIRGIGSVNNSDPLYIVDGVPLGDISTLNMQDVESMEVLKDASATAIYGSRGANGVIIIKTKGGKRGKAIFNFSGRLGVQSPGNKIDFVTAEQYANLRNQARMNDQINYPNEDWHAMPELADPASLGKGTDWFDAVTRNAVIRNNQFSVSGGSEKVTYYMSINEMLQEGIMNGTDFSRLTFRLNNSYHLNKVLTIGHNINISNSKRNIIPEWGMGNVSKQKILTNALGHEPITPVYDPNNPSSKYGYTKLGGNYENPVARVDYHNEYNKLFSVQGNIYADWKINDNITFRTNYGLVAASNEYRNFTPKYEVSPLQFTNNSSLNITNGRQFSQTWTNTLNYILSYGNHNFTTLVGQEFQTEKYSAIQSGIMGIPDNISKPSFSAGDISTATVNDNLYESALLSFFGRVNYNYADRYLLTANLRMDGSSKFGADNRWGIFPSVAMGWNLHNEDFWPKNSIITHTKLTAGYGKIGSQNFGNYMYYSQISGGQYYFFGSGNHLHTGAAPLMLGNPNLKWEASVTSNVGVELGLLQDKITLGVEYYDKTTTDMLLQIPIPDYSGIQTAPWTNGGELKNWGWEFTGTYKHQVSEKFSFNVGGNFSLLRNKMIDWGTENGFVDDGQFRGFPLLTRTQAGRQMSEFYLLKTDGIFQNEEEIRESAQPDAKPGDIRFVDTDGNGQIDDNDRDYCGPALPKLTYGFNLNATYGNFDITAFFQGVHGNKVFNGMRYYSDRSGVWNMNPNLMNSWHGEGTSNTIPRLTERDAETNLRASDYFLEDASFLRLRNLEVGYNIPSTVTDRLNLQNIRLSVSGQNLFTITKYTGMDPEIGKEPIDQLAYGIDRGVYPQARIISLGLNVTF